MKIRTRRGAIVLSLSILATSLLAQDIPIRNWGVDRNWRPPATLGIQSTQSLISGPVVFQAVDPCRLVDTRNPNGTFGGPAFANGTTRTFPFGGSTFSSCSPPFTVPSAVVAYSLNFTIVNNNSSQGFLILYPTGSPQPIVSNVNWITTDAQRGNAAIVPANASGSINVFANITVGTVDVIIDLNGIFVSTLPGSVPLTITSTGSQAAIVGMNSGGSTNGYGVTGQVTGNGSSSAGVRGVASGTGAGSAGISGLASGASGVLYGALGQETSTTADSAGVRGVNGAGSPGGFFAPAGVRGESAGGFGVLGTSGLVGTAGLAGVNGAFLNSSGTTLAEGRLGFSTGGTYYGVYSTTGDIGATGTKSFVVPHPTDPSRIIRYISMEGPEAGTYFRGRGRLEDRIAIIDVPESFRLVTEEDGLSIQVTPIGGSASLWIQEVGLNRIVVRGPRDLEFFYTVNGVRKGYSAFEPLSQGSEFVPESPSSRLPEGLNPETKRRLITNGTYNADGAVNMETAERLGWTKIWTAQSSAAVSR